MGLIVTTTNRSKFLKITAGLSAAFPLFFTFRCSQYLTIKTSYGYRFENYNSNGTNMDSGAGDQDTLTILKIKLDNFST